MKHISIVGIGMGLDTVTQAGMRAIHHSDVLIGAPRMLDALASLQKPSYLEYAPGKVAEFIAGSDRTRFAVLVSGDTGFYSAAEGISAALTDYEVTFLPGVSSLSYFCAFIQRPWQDVKHLSCHGRDANLTDTVRRNHLTFALTGGNTNELATRLADAGFGDLTVHIGENLGATDERIFSLSVSRLCGAVVGPLSVLLIENPGFDDRVRFGISDDEFIRGDAPMTKSEVRAVTLSKLSLRPGDICSDIGAGSGSVAVEMALAAYEGRVFAIDKEEETLGLVKQNCRAFHIGNVSCVCGTAPHSLTGFPRLDAAFIGGSGGGMHDIVSALISNNPDIRIVANAVALESVSAAVDALSIHGLRTDIVQVNCARARTSGGLHMMMAQNPVFIISGRGHE